MSEELVVVRLRELPVRLHARARQHSDEMRREFQLLVSDPDHQAGAPARLLELSQVLSQRYEDLSDQQEDAIEGALAAGQLVLDELAFALPAHAGAAAEQLGKVFDEADEFCRSGHLLTLATPPELVAYRRWYLDNVVVQCAGGEPRPWTAATA